ncbi:MAG: DUF4330 domain-containing protein [Defluviitaleaceae bacterium]|nr:DUF4330 domain-containing protein [Defluviitaleaceae bacterium]
MKIFANGKIFGVHLMDIIWLALLVLLIFGATQLAVPRQVQAQTGDFRIRYTIELGNRERDDGRRLLATDGFYQNIQIGDTLTEAAMGQEIGRIVDVYALPFEISAFNEQTGTFQLATVDGLELVYIVVESYATVTEYETLIGHFSVGVGRGVAVRSKFFAGEGFITAVEFD